MSEIHILQGELIVGGIVHGQALNCTVVPYDDPSDWFMVQFVTQQELDKYAMENKLAVKYQEK